MAGGFSGWRLVAGRGSEDTDISDRLLDAPTAESTALFRAWAGQRELPERTTLPPDKPPLIAIRLRAISGEAAVIHPSYPITDGSPNMLLAVLGDRAALCMP